MIFRAQSIQMRPGFSLIELMVVLTIMVVLIATLSINIRGQKSNRDMKIALSQIVSDIRKAQTYTLLSRTLPSGRAAQYYVVKFNLSQPSKYSIQGISDASTQPALEDVEVINLPGEIIISNISVSRPNNPTTQPIFTNCAIAAFAAPFAKILLNDGCVPVNSTQAPQSLNSSDDYYAKIINFLLNVDCISYNPANPTLCSVSQDSVMTVTLSADGGSLTRKFLINGITGVVCPTSDGLTCPVSN